MIILPPYISKRSASRPPRTGTQLVPSIVIQLYEATVVRKPSDEIYAVDVLALRLVVGDAISETGTVTSFFAILAGGGVNWGDCWTNGAQIICTGIVPLPDLIGVTVIVPLSLSWVTVARILLGLLASTIFGEVTSIELTFSCTGNRARNSAYVYVRGVEPIFARTVDVSEIRRIELRSRVTLVISSPIFILIVTGP